MIDEPLLQEQASPSLIEQQIDYLYSINSFKDCSQITFHESFSKYVFTATAQSKVTISL